MQTVNRIYKRNTINTLGFKKYILVDKMKIWMLGHYNAEKYSSPPTNYWKTRGAFESHSDPIISVYSFDDTAKLFHASQACDLKSAVSEHAKDAGHSID